MRLLKIGQYFVVLCGGDLLARAACGIDPGLEVGVVDGDQIVTLPIGRPKMLANPAEADGFSRFCVARYTWPAGIRGCSSRRGGRRQIVCCFERLLFGPACRSRKGCSSAGKGLNNKPEIIQIWFVYLHQIF
jgi:hypothetical protein